MRRKLFWEMEIERVMFKKLVLVLALLIATLPVMAQPQTIETMTCPLSDETFQKMSTAKAISFTVGQYTVDLDNENLSMFRSMYVFYFQNIAASSEIDEVVMDDVKLLVPKTVGIIDASKKSTLLIP